VPLTTASEVHNDEKTPKLITDLTVYAAETTADLRETQKQYKGT